MENQLKKYNFNTRLKSMLGVDFRRMFTMPLFYIVMGVCLVVPILIFVMISMMEGSPMNDQYGNPLLDEFGNPILMEGFKNVWQMLGTTSTSNSSMSMDITSMCNINMIFFGMAVLVGLFISQDFRSGYSKNLFTVRSSKTDYVISKIVVCFVCGIIMILLFFIGMLLGGKIAGVSFEMVDINIINIIMCVLSKIVLSLVFISIYVLMSVVGKHRTWLSILGGLGVSMLMFMMIPIVSPLDSTIMNVMLSLIGGVLFAYGFGALSNTILKKTSLV